MKAIDIKTFIRIVYLLIIIWCLILFFISKTDKKVFIFVDNKVIITDYVKDKILADILTDRDITLNPEDIVSDSLNKPVLPGQKINITRVTVKKGKEKIETEFRPLWKKIYKKNLRKVELQKGIVKTIDRDYTHFFYNGKFDRAVFDRERIISKTFYRLLLLTDDNKIEKIYDLSKAKRMKMVATAYYPGDPLAWKDGTVTFLGRKMQRGIIAVDPKVIPLKTRLYVSGYGYGYAGDTGSAIKGNRIDLGVNNAEEEKSWMFREVTVYILEKSDTY
ncbi:3D domain-containing protein [Candidatus Ruminimicrobium bovinum]|uniref:G5 and 3D domain-containing protein n=1 Tax=Candidatus Ruminimicrobium bovinum TaxID=3242779 RepID=UPI0039B8842F